MRHETETRLLECILTDQEKLSYGKQLVESVVAKSHAEDELKSFQTQQKAVIAQHDAKIALFSDKINTGREYRGIVCNVEFDFQAGVARSVRPDTSEVVNERKITDEERQEHMKLEVKE